MAEVAKFASVGMTTLLPSIIKWAVKLVRVDAGEIYLYESQQEMLRLVAGLGVPETYLGLTLKPGEGLAGKVLLSNEPLMVEDYRHWDGRSEAFEGKYLWTQLAVPLRWQERVIGVLVVATDGRRRRLDPDDVEIASICADLASAAIQNARLYEELQGSMLRLRSTLEQEVAERTARLAHRAGQLESARSGAGGAPATHPGLDELLGHVMELKIAQKVLDELTRIPLETPTDAGLTPREVDVLILLARGRSNKDIVQELCLSVNTVKFHIRNVLSKLHVTDRTQAALWAVRQGLVKQDEIMK